MRVIHKAASSFRFLLQRFNDSMQGSIAVQNIQYLYSRDIFVDDINTLNNNTYLCSKPRFMWGFSMQFRISHILHVILAAFKERRRGCLPQLSRIMTLVLR